MGIAEKKPDVLVALHGEAARRHQGAMALLLAGTLPDGWRWVASSREAVVAATLAEPLVFYKEFLARGPFEKIKSLWRGSRCQRARRQAEVLATAGLPCPAVLGWGTGRTNEFLLTEGFQGLGFFQFLKAHFRGRLTGEQLRRKRLLLQQAGTLIGRLHGQGISHGDLRQDNLLVREAAGRFTFCFVDNERNRRRSRLSKAAIITNLVQFAICSEHVLTQSDLLRLFTAYGRAFPRFSGAEQRRLATEVVRRSRRRIIHYIAKEALGRAAVLAGEQGRGAYVRQSVLARQLEAGRDLDQWFGEGTFCKDDRDIQVKKLWTPEGVVVAKKFRGRGILALCKAWCRCERPPRLWRMSHLFMALEIPLARPLGYVLAGHGPWRRQSYFFSAWAEGRQDLLSLSRQQPGLVARLLDQGLCGDIAHHLARLHNNGLCHGDTKWANIMVEPASGELLFIDLDGAGPARPPLARGMVKDVSRFVVDMLEQEMPPAAVRNFVREYSNMRVLPTTRVQKEITPHVTKALVRHGRADIDIHDLWSV
jgi:tRNA A-37 threonylcarbamoyl transferase component Bud32